jgi:hypothetical protein
VKRDSSRRETVGKISTDLLWGAQELDHSAEEQMREMLELWETNLLECIERGKKEFPHDFYIVVDTKKEPKMQNVLRNVFIPRSTCPTPTYDNSVYKYHRSDENLEFLWVLPSKSTCSMMKDRALEIPEDQKELLQFVLDDADGTLLRRCKTLNKEII